MIAHRHPAVHILLALLLSFGTAAGAGERPRGERWSLDGVKLFGVHDFNSLHFHGDKLTAYLEDVSRFGNCTLLVLERSDRACVGGWWGKVRDGDFVPQFGEYVRFPGDGKDAFNPYALEKLQWYWSVARARGLFVITTIFNPWDVKEFGAWPAMHGKGACGEERKLYRIPGRPETLKRQLAFARLVARAAQDHPNVILSDNWEEGSPRAGVNLAWKREIYRTVRGAGYEGPYLVYIGDRHGFDDREAALEWVRAEPGITGIQVHYEYPSPASLGLRRGQRVVHTEDHQLLLGPTAGQPGNRWIHQIFTHARARGVECCYLACDWRDFKRLDGKNDPLQSMRDEALRKLAGFY